MDIYRFFHPHHNPRLHSTPLRQQELSELEQAGSELLKAVERAMQRTGRKAVPPILPQHFGDIIKALRFVVSSLQTLCDAHPGDSPQVIGDLIGERSGFSGWENWTSLLKEQLSSSLHLLEGENGHTSSNGDSSDDDSNDVRQNCRPTSDDVGQSFKPTSDDVGQSYNPTSGDVGPTNKSYHEEDEFQEPKRSVA